MLSCVRESSSSVKGVRVISYQDQVEQAVFHEKPGRLLVAASLYRGDLTEVPEFTYYKALERMVSRRKLLRLSRGVYIRPEMQLGAADITNEIIRYYTEQTGKVFWGFRGGEYLLAQYGLAGMTDNKEAKVIIHTSRIAGQKRNVQNITLMRLPMKPGALQIAHLEFMELLTDYENYSNRDDFAPGAFAKYLSCFAEEYDDRVMADILKQCHYPKRIIAFADELLQSRGCRTSLAGYLAGTSRYRIPSWDAAAQ